MTEVSEALKDKSDSLAQKMNKLTEKLKLSEELELTGNDIIEHVKEKTEIVELNVPQQNQNSMLSTEIINLNTMVQDFKYIRETLKENTDNGRRVLNSVTLELLDVDAEKRASLITSFAELNRAVAENMKLYVTSYKEISNVLLNINKLAQAQLGENTNTANKSTQAISTVDLLKQLI